MTLDIIRNATIEELRDVGWLERAVIDLGIYPAMEIPQFLHNGNGLGICQHPCQVAPYLIHLSTLKIKRYAEIGVWVGGNFALTVEYLSRFGLKAALALDINVQQSVKNYVNGNPIADWVEAPSTSGEAIAALKNFRPDMILVDGDHTEEGCRADWEIAKSVAKYVAIHDIVGSGFPGVVNVWHEIDLPKKEWVDQYDPHHYRGDCPSPQNGMGLVTVK